MENMRIGLQPIKNFQRIVNPTLIRFTYSYRTTDDGKYIVTVIADYKNNPYKTAGLQVGDEIISINGILFKDLIEENNHDIKENNRKVDKEEKKEKEDRYTFKIMDILRNNKPMRLIIKVDNVKDSGE